MPQDKDPAKPPPSPVIEVKRPQGAPFSAPPMAPVVAAAQAVSKVPADDAPVSDHAPNKLLASAAIPIPQKAPETQASTRAPTPRHATPAEQASHQPHGETAMNAMSNQETLTPATSVLNGMAELFSINLQALSEAALAGKATAQAQAHLMATGKKNLESQIAHVTALAQVRSAQEALELQQRFARELVETSKDSASALANALTAGFKATVEPLAARYNEATKTPLAK